mmetsp:Transcript_10244/g.15381  ORF Transcript_10244/g.15381 Transcript_10244/m.15381 type:complete len:637 (-) Transcript_10244:212-2122(-)
MNKYLNLQMPLLHAATGIVSPEIMRRIVARFHINITEELLYDSNQLERMERERLQQRQQYALFHLQHLCKNTNDSEQDNNNNSLEYPPQHYPMIETQDQQLISPHDYYHFMKKEQKGKNVLFTLLRLFSPRTRPVNGVTYCQQCVLKKRERDSMLEHDLLRRFLPPNNNNNNNNDGQQPQQQGAGADNNNANRNNHANRQNNQRNDIHLWMLNHPLPPGAEVVEPNPFPNAAAAAAAAPRNNLRRLPPAPPAPLHPPRHRLMPLLRQRLNNNAHNPRDRRTMTMAFRYILRRLRDARQLMRDIGEGHDDPIVIDRMLERETEELVARIPNDLRAIVQLDAERHEEQQGGNQNNNDNHHLPARLREHLEGEIMMRINRMNERLIAARARVARGGFDPEFMAQVEQVFPDINREIDRFERHRQHRREEMLQAQENLGQGGTNGHAWDSDDEDGRRSDNAVDEQHHLRVVEKCYIKGLLDVFLVSETKTIAPQRSPSQRILINDTNDGKNQAAPSTSTFLPRWSASMPLRAHPDHPPRSLSAPTMVRSISSTPTTITMNCAQMKDSDGRLPLHLATELGMSLDNGLEDIIHANMNALLEPDGFTGFYPFALARDDVNVSYSLLLQNPAVMENVVKAMSG